MIFKEKQLTFHFDISSNSEVSKYDEWLFYRKHFIKTSNSTKAVDFVYIDKAGRSTWLIEVKDYRHPDAVKIKPSALANAVTLKVKDTLAGLVAARHNANVPEEKEFAKKALKNTQLNVVLHVEQKNNNRLFTLDLADLQTQLKQKVKAIDCHPCVVDQSSLKPRMSWTVKG